MQTSKQQKGEQGENLVVKLCRCPKCKSETKTLKRLRTNFKCADIICDFCGYTAQVKTTSVSNINILPNQILGAAWGPQKARNDAGIYIPLYVVLMHEKEFAIYYLAADLQDKCIFVPRAPLSPTAGRSGWQGFYYYIKDIKEKFVRIRQD